MVFFSVVDVFSGKQISSSCMFDSTLLVVMDNKMSPTKMFSLQGIPQHTERIFHSGPLLHQGYTASVDIEELLEDHERQVKQAARRAGEVRNSSGHGHKGGWNHVRSNGAAAQENTDSAESNGLVPTSGHHLISHQKRSKSRMMEQGLDSREAREVRDLEKETPPYGSEAHVKVQEV